MEVKKEPFRLLPNKINKEQAAGTGMAMVLLLLILGLKLDEPIFFKVAMPVLLLNMIYPLAFYPLAIVWLGIANVLGAFMPKIFLSILFMLLVVPVGLLRRFLKKDPLQLYTWKKGTASVMKDRNHSFSPLDLEKPY